MTSTPWSRRLLAAVGIFGLVFLTVPLLIVIPMSFSLGAGAHLSAARLLAALVRGLLRRSALDGRDVDLDGRGGAVLRRRARAGQPRGLRAAPRQLRRPRLGRGQLHVAADRAHHHRGHRALSQPGQGRAARLVHRPGRGAHRAQRAAGHDGDGRRRARASTCASSRWRGASARRGATPWSRSCCPTWRPASSPPGSSPSSAASTR